MPSLLWWGRSDNHYSRNQIILGLLAQLGWHIDFYHPVSSHLGKVQAFFKRLKPPDVIWVPCFRQRDMSSAIFWSRRWACPLVFDPLISAYEKEVFEKGKWRATDKPAVALNAWEAGLFRQADVVIADTQLHAQFFIDTFQLKPERLTIVHVGADEQIFRPTEVNYTRPPLEVLFYGSFLLLQGPDVIIAAARQLPDENIRWVLLGNGDLRSRLEAQSKGLSNVVFEPWISYDRLPQRLSRAHILLGIFGTTPKAGMVIPNKVFQSMAVGRPLITRYSEAYPKQLRDSSVIGWVPAGDARALALQVEKMAAEPDKLVHRGHQTRMLYEHHFSIGHIQRQLQRALDTALASRIK
jgi:glycosyltransferase involved in cell wall biosynthesis